MVGRDLNLDFLVGKTGKDLVGQQLHRLVKPLVEVKGLVPREHLLASRSPVPFICY